MRFSHILSEPKKKHQMSLKIRSVNVRAIGDNAKRREVFNWLRAKNFSIYMIQEAHCTENKYHIWRAEWRFQSIFSYCTCAKAGVGILFNNNFKLKVLKTFFNPEGCLIITDIERDERKLTLANIYAPNDNNPRCFRKNLRPSAKLQLRRNYHGRRYLLF